MGFFVVLFCCCCFSWSSVFIILPLFFGLLSLILCHKSRAVNLDQVCCSSETTCFAATSVVLDPSPALSSWRGKHSLCPQGLPAGGEAVSSCRISLDSLWNYCPISYISQCAQFAQVPVDHLQTFRATCLVFGILHFCFVWISGAELGSWRAFDETASLRKEAGNRSPLLSASLSLLEQCEGWERAWEGGFQGSGA